MNSVLLDSRVGRRISEVIRAPFSWFTLCGDGGVRSRAVPGLPDRQSPGWRAREGQGETGPIARGARVVRFAQGCAVREPDIADAQADQADVTGQDEADRVLAQWGVILSGAGAREENPEFRGFVFFCAQECAGLSSGSTWRRAIGSRLDRVIETPREHAARSITWPGLAHIVSCRPPAAHEWRGTPFRDACSGAMLHFVSLFTSCIVLIHF
jgi:hypothetical protein